MGFGDNDHAIRGLMRFIKMTNREFRIKDVIRNRGAPNYKCWRLQTQRRFKFFYILNLSIGMSYCKGGHNKLAKMCNQVLNLIHIHPQLLSQDSQLNLFLFLSVWLGAVVPHLERGTATVQHRHDLSDRWGLGGTYTCPFPLQCLSSLSHSFSSSKNRRVPFSLSSIGDLELPSILPWFSHQSLREKGPKLN